MTWRWRFMTSSYLSTFLRISKFCASTCDWALLMALVTILASIGTSSGMLNRREEGVDDVALEQPHEVVLERQVEARLARVALTAGAAAQLVVDAPRLVALGAGARRGLRGS